MEILTLNPTERSTLRSTIHAKIQESLFNDCIRIQVAYVYAYEV